ncbi:MAG: hypothetical protein OEY33_03760 [Bdellovibrionales bacterium]|nr:hypothetical protein [Bdellovibrionales bacterium]
MNILTTIFSFIILTSSALAKDDYKTPNLPQKWVKTAEKIIKSRDRAPASISMDSEKTLLTLDEIAGKNKKKALPKARAWKIDLIR